MISMCRKHFSLFMFFVCDDARKNMCDRHRPELECDILKFNNIIRLLFKKPDDDFHRNRYRNMLLNK
jgi:hypothetical protein